MALESKYRSMSFAAIRNSGSVALFASSIFNADSALATTRHPVFDVDNDCKSNCLLNNLIVWEESAHVRISFSFARAYMDRLLNFHSHILV